MSFFRFRRFLILALLLLNHAQCIQFANDGSIPAVVKAQSAVENNPSRQSLLYIRYHSAAVVLRIARNTSQHLINQVSDEDNERSNIFHNIRDKPVSVNTLNVEKDVDDEDPDDLFMGSKGFQNANTRVYLIGRQADCIAAVRFCQERELLMHKQTGTALSAAEVAYLLANWTYSQTLQDDDRLIVINALVVDKQHDYGRAFLVDVCGNFHFCRAGSIGFGSERMNSWLNTRGRFIAGHLQKLQQQHQNRSDYEKNQQWSDLQCCLNITQSCLHENIGNKLLCAGNVSVAVASYTQQPSGSCITGLWTIPADVFNVTNSILKEEDASSTAESTEETAGTKDASIKSTLWHWWYKRYRI